MTCKLTPRQPERISQLASVMALALLFCAGSVVSEPVHSQEAVADQEHAQVDAPTWPDQDPGEYVRTSRFIINLGAGTWPALSDLNSSYGGGFDNVGMDIDVGWHVVAWKGWLWGLDAGLYYTSGDVPALLGDLEAESFFVTPSVKIPLGKGNQYLEAGVGYYSLSFVDMNCDFNPCIQFENGYDKSTTGGYLGFARDFAIGTRGYFWSLGFRIHYANFGTPEGLGPSPGTVDGPVYMILLGWGG